VFKDPAAEYRFDRFAVRPGPRQLLVDGLPVKLGGRAFDTLLALIERRERVVTKNELLELVWSGLVVEEANLQVQVVALRKLLGPGAIATIPGRGYKFTLLLDGFEVPGPASIRNLPALEDASAPACNAPAQLPALYGRDEEVAALAQLVRRHRLVSVVGPGGIGKTRVAQAVAHALRGDFEHGVWLVELAPLADPELVVSSVARVLGSALAPKGAALASLVEAIKGQRLLLVLDNCEQLSAAVEELAVAILAGAPGVHLLVTSQEPLRVVEEQVDRLQPLAVPEKPDAATALRYGAVALFAARARAADARFAINSDNVDAVVEICSSLDGIALAIELAAARVPMLGVYGVRQRLDARLKFLAGGPRGALPRHKTLRAALEWSHTLLSAQERSVFDRLGVFVGTFSLEAAQRITTDDAIDPWDALDHLAALVDKSLVLVEDGPVPRYRLLESSRMFALERLDAAGAIEASRKRHAQALVYALGRPRLLDGPSARVQRNAPDLDNVRAAMAWATGPRGDQQIAVELMGTTDHLWYFLGCNDEGAEWFRRVEPWVSESTPPAVAARFWLAAADLYTHHSVRRQAEAAMKAADLFRLIKDWEGLFLALGDAVSQFSLMGERVSAERALDEASSLAQAAWPAWTRGFLECLRGQWHFFCLREPDGARRHLLKALENLRRDDGDVFFAATCQMELLLARYALRDFAGVVCAGRELLRQPASVAGHIQAIVSITLGAALVGVGELAQAESTLRAALPPVKRTTGTVSWALNHLAFLVARQGRIEEAARLIGFIDGSRTGQSIIQSPSQRCSYDEAMAIVGSVLGDSALEQLKAEGRLLSEDQATALALSEENEADINQ
jgi:predicted ATPase